MLQIGLMVHADSLNVDMPINTPNLYVDQMIARWQNVNVILTPQWSPDIVKCVRTSKCLMGPSQLILGDLRDSDFKNDQ